VRRYRRVVQGWSAEEALDELRGGGFGFDELWDDIEALVRELDARRVQSEFGLIAPERATQQASELVLSGGLRREHFDQRALATL